MRVYVKRSDTDQNLLLVSREEGKAYFLEISDAECADPSTSPFYSLACGEGSWFDISKVVGYGNEPRPKGRRGQASS